MKTDQQIGTPELIAATGIGAAFTLGTATGFDHTVQLAHRNGAGNYWDVVTAVTVEVLALTGTAMLVSFHRRGWKTRGPFTLIALGVAATLGAQVAYRAAPDPNAFLGYVVAGTPTSVALMLIAVAHSAYGYASADRVEFTADVVGGGVPAAHLEPVPDDVSEDAPAPPEVHPAESVSVPTPTRPRVSKASAEPRPQTEAGTPDDVARVRALKVNPQTGKPTIRAVRAALRVGQPKAQELRDAAYPEAKNDQEEKQNEAQKNPSVTKEQDHQYSPVEEAADREKEQPHHRKSLEQGSLRSAGEAPHDLLHLVREG